MHTLKIPVLLYVTCLLFGCVHTDSDGEYDYEARGLQKSFFRSTQWELVQTITVAPEIFGDIVGFSTGSLLVEWDIALDHLVAVQRADASVGALDAVISAYPIAHISTSQELPSDDGYRPADPTPWYQRENILVEWSDVIAFDERFGDELVRPYEPGASLAPDADHLGYASADAEFPEGELVFIEFEEVIEFLLDEPACAQSEDVPGCTPLRIYVTSEYRRTQ
jgi:hypothetical protein